MDERPTRVLAIGSVVAAALLWSSSYAVTKEVLADVGPLTIGAVRFTIAAVLLGIMVRIRRDPVTRPDAPQRQMIYLSGLLGITSYFILENIGVKLSTASDAALIVASYPLMTMLVELVLFRARMPLLRVGGVLIAAGGAFLIVRNGAEVGGSGRWFGDVLLLLGGLVWAGYNVLAKHAGRGQDSLTLTYYQTLAGAAGFLLASLLEIGDWRVPAATPAELLVYLAVACSVGGFLLYNYGLRRMTSSVAVNILNLVPVFGVLGAVVINGERVRLAQLLGGVVIIAGVALGLVERRTGVEKPPSPILSRWNTGRIRPTRCRPPGLMTSRRAVWPGARWSRPGGRGSRAALPRRAPAQPRPAGPHPAPRPGGEGVHR